MLQTGNEGDVRGQLTFQSLQQECCSLPRPTVANEAEDALSLLQLPKPVGFVWSGRI
jgi:hypothetical protein